jgi:hypothetical protein
MKAKSTTNNKKGEPAMDTSEMTTAERIADGKNIVLANTEYDRLTGERQDTELVDALGTIAHYTARPALTPEAIALHILKGTAEKTGVTFSDNDLKNKATSVRNHLTSLAQAWHRNHDARIVTTSSANYPQAWFVLSEDGDYADLGADRAVMVELPPSASRSLSGNFALLRYQADGGMAVSTRRGVATKKTWELKSEMKEGVSTGRQFVNTFTMPQQCLVGIINSYQTLEEAIDCLDELNNALGVVRRICKEVKTAQSDDPAWEKEALANDALDALVKERATKAPAEADF